MVAWPRVFWKAVKSDISSHRLAYRRGPLLAQWSEGLQEHRDQVLAECSAVHCIHMYILPCL